MLSQWIMEHGRTTCPYCFPVIDITEHTICTEVVKNYIANFLLCTYRDPEYLKRHFGNKHPDELKKYIKEKIFVPPQAVDSPSQNTKQGDWGEALSALILLDFRHLCIPVSKLRYKANNSRSMLGTDLFAICLDSTSEEITKLVYGEVKTRRTYSSTVGVEAYKGLYSDYGRSLGNIIDFCIMRLEEQHQFELAEKLTTVYDNLNKYAKEFEIFLIVERNVWKEDILVNLNNIPPNLSTLRTNVMLIDGLKTFMDEIYEKAVDEGVKLVYG